MVTNTAAGAQGLLLDLGGGLKHRTTSPTSRLGTTSRHHITTSLTFADQGDGLLGDMVSLLQTCGRVPTVDGPAIHQHEDHQLEGYEMICGDNIIIPIAITSTLATPTIPQTARQQEPIWKRYSFTEHEGRHQDGKGTSAAFRPATPRRLRSICTRSVSRVWAN
jgi:hypothetical protein